jgi:hypothetical protein
MGVLAEPLGPQPTPVTRRFPRALVASCRNFHLSEAEVNNICHLLDLVRTRALAVQAA